jgi:hypothetical protein
MYASLLEFFLFPHMRNKMALLQLLYYGCSNFVSFFLNSQVLNDFGVNHLDFYL